MLTDERLRVIKALATTPDTCCAGCGALRELITEVTHLRQDLEDAHAAQDAAERELSVVRMDATANWSDVHVD